MIEESYVSFDTAKMLKEAGFDVPTSTHYSNSGEVWKSSAPEDCNDDKSCNACSRPTQALAARWLREVHDTFVKVERVSGMFGTTLCVYWSYDIFTASTACLESISTEHFDCYEEALEAGLQEAIKMIKK